MTRAFWSLCFIATVGLIGLCSADEHAIKRSREVILHSLNIDTTTAVEFHEDYDHLQRVRKHANNVEHQYLVHVARAITEEEKASIESQIGTKFGAYIPHNTFLLVADQQSANRAVGHPLVQWVGDYAPQYKISNAVNTRPSQRVVVTLAPKTRSVSDAQRIASSWESSVNGKVAAVSADTIEVTVSDINDLSSTVRWISEQPESHFIEPAVNYVPLNFYASQEIQAHANSTPITTVGLKGTGVLVGLADTGIRSTSCYFSNGGAAPTNTLNLNAYKIVRYISSTGDSTDANGHGTSVAGTIAGESSSSGTAYDGIASGAKIHFTDLQSGSGNLNVPADIKSIFSTPAADGVTVFVTPFGSANSADWYGTDAASIDTFMNANPNFLVVTSAGNNRSLSSLALSKNALVVGSSMSSVAGIVNQQSASFQSTALNNPALYGPHVLSSFSAVGPTPDGRMKPDIVAPGQSLYSASNAGDCNLASVQGTSYAAGVAGAAAAITTQYFTDSYYPSGFPDPVNGLYKTPQASLIKAMILHSGQQLTLTDLNGNGLYTSLSEYPSALQGFGRIQLDQSLIANAYSPSSKDLFVYPDPSIGAVQSLTTGQSLRYCLQTVTSNANLKATLVWTDKEASAAAGHILVNDLDLAVVAQDGTTYRTNTAGGEFDSFNNVEQVVISGLAAGTSYAIHVYGRNIPVGPQTFSLVISGDVAYADCVGDFDSPDSLNRTCPNKCSGFGACNSDGFCVCNSRIGLDCSLVACPTSSGVVCSGNGYCDYATSTCTCAQNYDPSNNCLTALPPPPPVSNSTSTFTPAASGGPYTAGLLAGTVVAAFIVGAVCSVFLGGFIAVKYLEYRRDKIQKQRETEEAEMH